MAGSMEAELSESTTQDYNYWTSARESESTSSNWTMVHPEWQGFKKFVSFIILAAFGSIFVLGLFGNSLVILVVLADKHMRNTTNILIISLAAADLLFILICVPFTAVDYVLPVWPLGEIGCKAIQYALYVSAYASVYTLVMMSLDRYLAVVHAIRSRSWRSERNTWIAIAVVWVAIFCGNIPIPQKWGVYKYTENRSACFQVSRFSDENSRKTFYGCFFFFSYVIPLGVTMLLYGLILKRLLYGVVPGGGKQSSQIRRGQKRVTRMLVVVLVIFALSWLPIQILLFWQNVLDVRTDLSFLTTITVANCLSYTNGCVNPILYSFLSGKFRRSFRRFLCCSERSANNRNK